MQIPSNSYPVVRTPPAPVPRREDVRVEDDTAAAVSEVAQTAPRRAQSAATSLSLSADMQRAALRGRPVEANTSYASRQALAEYADVVGRNDRAGQIEVLGFDDFA